MIGYDLTDDEVEEVMRMSFGDADIVPNHPQFVFADLGAQLRIAVTAAGDVTVRDRAGSQATVPHDDIEAFLLLLGMARSV